MPHKDNLALNIIEWDKGILVKEIAGKEVYNLNIGIFVMFFKAEMHRTYDTHSINAAEKIGIIDFWREKYDFILFSCTSILTFERLSELNLLLCLLLEACNSKKGEST